MRRYADLGRSQIVLYRQRVRDLQQTLEQAESMQRRDLVERFQTARGYVPYMVLSVKAAGGRLNLTRANRIVHFDRWWNPAGEGQATERAFRNGQTRNVIVHKFVCRGTGKEKIGKLIADKVALSEQIVASNGENWLTEMSNTQLSELFTLAL